MEATYIRAKVPNSFSRRMKLLCNTLVEHEKLTHVRVGKRMVASLDHFIFQ